MLVILMGDRIISPQTVCQNCLLADHSGQPRWRGGQLRCAQAMAKSSDNHPNQYQCQMGFRVANIE